jgi:hypothetical protein|tara:strand:+ start:1753 stop:1950 length:198 start_codon:yes stop_codon:yes gene_type:complete
MQNKNKMYEIKVSYKTPKGSTKTDFMTRYGIDKGEIYCTVINYLVNKANRKIDNDLSIRIQEKVF